MTASEVRPSERVVATETGARDVPSPATGGHRMLNPATGCRAGTEYASSQEWPSIGRPWISTTGCPYPCPRSNSRCAGSSPDTADVCLANILAIVIRPHDADARGCTTAPTLQPDP